MKGTRSAPKRRDYLWSLATHSLVGLTEQTCACRKPTNDHAYSFTDAPPSYGLRALSPSSSSRSSIAGSPLPETARTRLKRKRNARKRSLPAMTATAGIGSGRLFLLAPFLRLEGARPLFCCSALSCRSTTSGRFRLQPTAYLPEHRRGNLLQSLNLIRPSHPRLHRQLILGQDARFDCCLAAAASSPQYPLIGETSVRWRRRQESTSTPARSCH